MFSRLKTEYFEALIGGRNITERTSQPKRKIRIRIIVVRYLKASLT
jgi:hypothetical protein